MINRIVVYKIQASNGVVSGKYEFVDFYGDRYDKSPKQQEKYLKEVNKLYNKAMKMLLKNKNVSDIQEKNVEIE